MIVVILGVLEFPLINLGLMKGIYRGGIGFSSPSSFMKEPDWYGFLCMYLALIFCVYKIKNSNLMFKKNINDLFFYICLFGLAISLARAAWIGFVVGAFILFIFSDMKIKQRYLKSMMVILILVVVSFVSLQIMKPDVTEKLINRINPSTTLETDNGAADSRMGSIRMMLYYIDIHPWVGNGVGGMGYLSSDKNVTSKFVDGEMNSGRGNANLILSSLFDSGIIGTIGLLFFIISYIKELFRRYSKSEDVILLAFTISFIGQLVDFMFNNGIRYSFVWLIFALSLAYKWDEIDFSPDINTPA
jgi:O-antigen ligase